MLALCNRLSPIAADARRIVAEGGIGRLYAARVMTLADQARIWVPRTRDWTFRRAEAGGGHLLWLGIHWLDLLLYLTGARVTAVQALTANAGGAPIDVEDVATVNLRLEGGALASLVSGYALASGAQKQIDLALWGADGWLRADVEHRHLEWQREAAGGREATRRRHGLRPPRRGLHPLRRRLPAGVRLGCGRRSPADHGGGGAGGAADHLRRLRVGGTGPLVDACGALTPGRNGRTGKRVPGTRRATRERPGSDPDTGRREARSTETMSETTRRGPRGTYRAVVIGETGQGNYGHGIDLALCGLPDVEVVAIADADPAGRAAAQRLGANPTPTTGRCWRPSAWTWWPSAPASPTSARPCSWPPFAPASGPSTPRSLSPAPWTRPTGPGAADARGVAIAVAHQNRGFPGPRLALRLIREGKVGRLRASRRTASRTTAAAART